MISKVRFCWEDSVDPIQVHKAWEKAFERRIEIQQWNALWKWRFADCPLNDRIYAAYISEHGRVACFYAISPLTILRDDRSTLKAGLAVWGFTHPDFQGKGYYSEMYQSTQNKLGELGFDCLLAFDNHNSHYPEVKYLGWRDIGLLTTFSLDCKNIMKHCSLKPGQIIADVDLSEPLLRSLTSFHTNGARFHIERGYAYLKWRLLDNPINTYRAMVFNQDNTVIAAIIYKRYGSSELDIMESFFRDEGESEMLDCYRILLSGLAKSEGISQLNIWSQLRSSEHLFLEKLGFKERCFSTYFICHPMKLANDILDISNWHYRFIDSDVY